MRYGTALLSLVALLGGCRSAAEPERYATSGTIVARDVQLSSVTPPSIHVTENAADPCGCVYGIGPATEIRRRTNGGGLVSATYADLAIGKRVRVWSGLVLLSCPGQGAADAVEILP